MMITTLLIAVAISISPVHSYALSSTTARCSQELSRHDARPRTCCPKPRSSSSYVLPPPRCSAFQLHLLTNRRDVIATAAAAIFISTPTPSQAATYISGKNPKGKPNKDGDTKGTRKDPAFLRSLSTCKSQCESASNTISKSKEDCLEECQEICCTTYEQCTFAIIPQI